MMRASQTTMSHNNNNNKPITARNTKNQLPNISNLQINYSQRYQHVTKTANYNQMNQTQIWKQYQKLRICLKQLNDQVLYHMEKKAYNNLNKPQKLSIDTIHQIAIMDQESRLNSQRLINFTNQYYQVQQRSKYLQTRTNIIQQINQQMELIKAKIKNDRVQNKDLKRRSKMAAKQIQNGPTLQQKLVYIDQQWGSADLKKGRLNKTLQKIEKKIKQFQERSSQLQKTIELRIDQFNNQQNYIEQQINFQRFDELIKQRQNIKRYKNVYQRNYLMKLKELQILLNCIKKYDQAINQNQSNILNMKNDIDSLSSMILNKGDSRKRAGSSLYFNLQQKSRQKRNATIITDDKNNRNTHINQSNKQVSISKFKTDDKNKRSQIENQKKYLYNQKNHNNQNKTIKVSQVV